MKGGGQAAEKEPGDNGEKGEASVPQGIEEKTADRQVQTSIEGVFTKFRELGSARQTMLWYRDEQIPLPEIVPGTAGREVHWRLPSDGRIRQILKNPCYAGVLAYGRTEAKTTTEDGRVRKLSTRRRKPRDQWKVLITDKEFAPTLEPALKKLGRKIEVIDVEGAR